MASRKELYNPVRVESLPEWLPDEQKAKFVGTRDPADRAPIYAPEGLPDRQPLFPSFPPPPAERKATAPAAEQPAPERPAPRQLVGPEPPSHRRETSSGVVPVPPSGPLPARARVAPEAPVADRRRAESVLPTPPQSPLKSTGAGHGLGEPSRRGTRSDWPASPERPRSRDTGLALPPEPPEVGGEFGGDMGLSDHIAMQQFEDSLWQGGMTTFNPFGGG